MSRGGRISRSARPEPKVVTNTRYRSSSRLELTLGMTEIVCSFLLSLEQFDWSFVSEIINVQIRNARCFALCRQWLDGINVGV